MERKDNGLNVKKFHSLKASPLHVPAQSKKPLSVANFLNNTLPPPSQPFQITGKKGKRILTRKLQLPIGAECVKKWEVSGPSSTLPHCQGTVAVIAMLIWCHLGNAQFSICHVGSWVSNHRSGDIWGASPSCLMWCNWNEMNLRTSEGKELPLPHLKLLFLKMLFK